MFAILKRDKKITFSLLLIFSILSFFSFCSIYLQSEAFKLFFSDGAKNIGHFLLFQLLSFSFEFFYRVLSPLTNILVDKQISKTIIEQKKNLVAKISNYNPNKFNNLGQSEIIYDLEENTNEYFGAYIQNFYAIVFNIFIFGFLVLFVIIQSILFSIWILVILFLIFLAIIISFLIPFIFMKKNQKLNKTLLDTRSKELSFFGELIKGYKYFYAHNQTNSFVNQFLFISTVFLVILNPLNKFIILILEPIFDGLKYSAQSTIAKGKNSKLLKPLVTTFDKYDQLVNDGSTKEISQIKKINFSQFNFLIEIENRKLYFENLNLEFLNNHKYFISGNSGVGKTNLIKCLLKETTNFQGKITINDIDLKKSFWK